MQKKILSHLHSSRSLYSWHYHKKHEKLRCGVCFCARELVKIFIYSERREHVRVLRQHFSSHSPERLFRTTIIFMVIPQQRTRFRIHTALAFVERGRLIKRGVETPAAAAAATEFLGAGERCHSRGCIIHYLTLACCEAATWKQMNSRSNEPLEMTDDVFLRSGLRAAPQHKQNALLITEALCVLQSVSNVHLSRMHACMCVSTDRVLSSRQIAGSTLGLRLCGRPGGWKGDSRFCRMGILSGLADRALRSRVMLNGLA